jgi:hypothetical protein
MAVPQRLVARNSHEFPFFLTRRRCRRYAEAIFISSFLSQESNHDPS